LAKWRSIKVNVPFSLINSLRYLIFSSVRTVFGRPPPGFRSVADPRSSTRLQIAFTEQSFQFFFRKFCNNRSVSKTKFLQCLDPSFIFLRYFTHNNCGYDLKYWKIYYNAMLHVNIKIMTSQQMWYLLLSYFNNINLSKWHHHHHHHHHRHVTFPPKHLPAHFAFH